LELRLEIIRSGQWLTEQTTSARAGFADGFGNVACTLLLWLAAVASDLIVLARSANGTTTKARKKRNLTSRPQKDAQLKKMRRWKRCATEKDAQVKKMSRQKRCAAEKDAQLKNVTD